MSLVDRLGVLLIIGVVAHLSRSQTTGSDVPNSPLWPLFSQLLSTQTGRTVQDINALGLSDPTIKQLWMGYSETLAKLLQTPAPAKTTTTTPPPLPDLYQNSYSFSSSGSQAASAASASTRVATAKRSDRSVLYKDILNLINKLSGPSSPTPQAPSAPQVTSTSVQDVMNAYAQLSGSSSPNSMQTMMDRLRASSGASTSGGSNYQALVQQYLSSTGGGAASSDSLVNKLSGTSGTSAKSTSSAATSYQSLMDQYNNIMNQGGAATSPNSMSSGSSYEQLLQQYNQIMGGKTLGTSATSGSPGGASSASSSLVEQYMSLSKKSSATGTPSDQLMQMYAQMMGGKAPDTNSSAPTTTSSPVSAQETFEKQLSTFFPQFKSLFPQSSAGNATSASSRSGSGNTAQMIFDAILFAPPQTATGGTSSVTVTETSTQAPPVVVTESSPGSIVQNLMKSRVGTEALLSNHVQNVFKTRASREMGCRFLPELLELDLLPTTPLNCMNQCPFPYVNSQQYGVYCVCCPPGVNEQTVGMMSVVRGNSYMETPLAVVS